MTRFAGVVGLAVRENKNGPKGEPVTSGPLRGTYFHWLGVLQSPGLFNERQFWD